MGISLALRQLPHRKKAADRAKEVIDPMGKLHQTAFWPSMGSRKLAKGMRITHMATIMISRGGQTAPVARTIPDRMKAMPKGMKPHRTMDLMWMAMAFEGLAAGRKRRRISSSLR